MLKERQRAYPDPDYKSVTGAAMPGFPFTLGEATIQTFAFRTHAIESLQALLKSTFEVPSGGKVQARLFTNQILVSFIQAEQVHLRGKSNEAIGFLPGSALWFGIPIQMGIAGDEATRVGFYQPFLFTDNQYYMQWGREVVGLPLGYGDFRTERQENGTVRNHCSILGYKYADEPVPMKKGDLCKLTVFPTEKDPKADLRVQPDDEEYRIVLSVLESMEFTLYALNQFRHPTESGKAAYQAIYEYDFQFSNKEMEAFYWKPECRLEFPAQFKSSPVGRVLFGDEAIEGIEECLYARVLKTTIEYRPCDIVWEAGVNQYH